ncbi:YeeE/YedE family protein [Ideonella sp. TBM-1]|uniref:YeeE/YedE family protein n=2 Tax=Ideonella livida TaxID=2707176 RepID=A0A7C9TIY1_9BURK|nr:YeeE/YedE family protein [Ideonella livida]
MRAMLHSLFPLGWVHYLAGGLLLGTGVGLLFLLTGRIGGMSTVFSSTWTYVVDRPFFRQVRLVDSRAWRLVYALGLVAGAGLWWGLSGADQTLSTGQSPWRLLLGGLLVGFGARLANGCTSGHGLCGLGSLHWPSLVAVLTFMAAAFATAQWLHHLGV